MRRRLLTAAAGPLLVAAVAVAAACTGEKPRAAAPGEVTAVAAAATPDQSASAAAATAPVAPTAKVAAPLRQEPPALELLGHQDFGGQGFTGNVRALDGFAYLGSWGSGSQCPALGVRVVDLAVPAAPAHVATTARFAGTSAEDVVPVRVATAAFQGNLLAAGIQRCSSVSGAASGLALVDITDPRNPVELSFFDTGRGSRGVHELDVTVRPDGQVLALLAVPFSESSGPGDVRILDISDPRRPVQLAHWGVRAGLGISAGTGCNTSVYAHSVRVSRDGMRLYASYWDAGVIVLDIADPAAPRVVTRLYEPDSEGAIHSVDEMENGLLLVAEEDDVFRSPRGLMLRAEVDGTVVEVPGCYADGVEPERSGVVSGGLSYLGDGCTAVASGPVALVEGGGCGTGQKARLARNNGAQVLVVIARGGQAKPPLDEPNSPIPVVGVSFEHGARLRDVALSGGAQSVVPSARPWGGVRVWDISNPAQPVRRALYRTANAQVFPPPGPGFFTVHNPLALGRYVLLSWYADGVRLLDMAGPDSPREVASFVPPPAADPFGAFPRAAEVWGVALHGDLVLASDINSGLWVLRLHGAQ